MGAYKDTNRIMYVIFFTMEKYKIIILKSELKSFQWNDGLFAIYKQVGDILHLWKIKDGKLWVFQDGTPNITCTGINNKGITSTDMIISCTQMCL